MSADRVPDAACRNAPTPGGSTVAAGKPRFLTIAYQLTLNGAEADSQGSLDTSVSPPNLQRALSGWLDTVSSLYVVV
jgi:hypothetical protein